MLLMGAVGMRGPRSRVNLVELDKWREERGWTWRELADQVFRRIRPFPETVVEQKKKKRNAVATVWRWETQCGLGVQVGYMNRNYRDALKELDPKAAAIFFDGTTPQTRVMRAVSTEGTSAEKPIEAPAVKGVARA